MNRVSQITSVDELIKLWPRLWALALVETPTLKAQETLQQFLTGLETGAVFIVKDDHGLAGSCCVIGHGDYATLQSIPNDRGLGLAKSCVEAMQQWAKAEGYKKVFVSTTKLCGSRYRYFENTLGFRRHSWTFCMNIEE